MEYDVYVMQIISDGPAGYPKDEVVDVGICGITFDKMEIDSLYSMVVRYDTSQWNDDKKEYLGHSSLTLDDIASGIDIEEACKDVKDLLSGRSVASFDIRNVFYRYMVNEPWDLTKEVNVMPSVSSRLPSSLRCSDPSKENSKILESYTRSFDGDPMDIKDGRRALDHALMTSAVLMELRKRGKY